MAGLSISRAWDETKARIVTDGRLFTIVAAALLLLPQAIVAAIAPPQELSGVEPSGMLSLLALVAGIIGIVGQVAIIRLAQVPGSSVGEAITHGARRLLPIIGAIIILCIAIFLVAVPLMLLIGGFAAIQAAGGAGGAMTNATVATAALVIVLLGVLVSPKLLMMMPVASAEAGGSIHLLKRSWSLSNGHYWRLLGFVLLILVAAMIVVLAAQFVIGAVLAAVFGQLEPLSLGALLYALLFGAAQAAFAVVVSVMLARLYVQLAGREALDVTVPKSGT